MITLRQAMPEVRERRCGSSGRELIGVRGLLEWAFGVEFATLEYDEVSEALYGRAFAGIGSEYRIMQQLRLGKKRREGVRVDTSFGTSHPHDDAEMVATVLRNSVRWDLAVRVAELARTGRVPTWDLGPQRLVPREWSNANQYGARGKTEVCREVRYVSRGRARVRKDMWVPCKVVPSAAQIAAARRAYLDWWGALLSVQAGLRAVELQRFELTGAMPPLHPWRKRS